jgi:hypothetical protein
VSWVNVISCKPLYVWVIPCWLAKFCQKCVAAEFCIWMKLSETIIWHEMYKRTNFFFIITQWFLRQNAKIFVSFFHIIREALKGTEYCISKSDGDIWQNWSSFPKCKQICLIKLLLRKSHSFKLSNIWWVKDRQLKIWGESSHCFPCVQYKFYLVFPIPS